jgi:hypothetical protein
MAAKTSIITVRVETELLDALKRLAIEERRSLSSEVVWLLGRAVGPIPGRAPSVRSMGMFADAGFDDLELDDFRRARRQASKRLMSRARRRRRAT